MILSHEYALRLETAFRRGDHCTVTADAFQCNFKGALEDGLMLLVAENLITISEMNAWIEEYDFANKSLMAITANEADKERVEELLRRLNHIADGRSEEK